MSVLPSGNDSRFKRHAFFSRVKAHSTNVVLVHYIGDESIATDFPHGNARNNQPYYRTCPSLMEKLTDIRDLPGNIYKDAVSKCQCPPQCMPVLMPRNTQQIANLQKKERQNFALHMMQSTIFMKWPMNWMTMSKSFKHTQI